MAKYVPGDYVKAEFKNDENGESEWMWVKVESSRFTSAHVWLFGQQGGTLQRLQTTESSGICI
jgi:hypothetical protein